MKQTAFFIIFISCLFGCKKDNPIPQKAGDFDFETITELPNVLKESSGLETAADFEFWSHNDRGGEPKLFKFDTLGRLNQTVLIENAKNEDWEDLTSDVYGNLYVGDFGNNDNDRKDLTIYKILSEDLNDNNNSILASKIEFSFPEQTAFPPPESGFFFDIESMFSKGDYLYLLTRDRSKPFFGKTTLHRIPNSEGTYEAAFLGELMTDSKKSRGQITAADLSPDGTKLAMISNEVLWLFENISDENFFSGDMTKVDLPVKSDMEGLVFSDNCTIYLSNENSGSNGGNLYRIRVCN